ncbi:MAG: peptide ABC transporter substrate-binding protein, partial [Bdellovibrionales bacterium]|nr:peptide ABC transporter substrate-binding protein [Bdellovibrionales bacterium]
PTLDWNKSTDTTSSRIVDNLMEGLTEYNFDDPELTLQPGLAEKWSSSKDAKTWTFTLRKNVTWSDGVPLTTKHVLDGWVRLLSPSTASEYAYFLYNIKNGEKFSKGEVKDASQLGIKAIDDQTIEVQLENTMSFFPYLLTHTSTFPVRLDLIEKFGDKWTDAANFVGLGPYSLKVWDHDKALVLERNDKYYGQPAILKNVIYYMISELSTAINLFDAGKLDALDELPKSEMAALTMRPEHKKHSFLVLQYYGFNVEKPPFNNINLRKAIAHAIDKKEIVEVMGSQDIPLKSWVPAGMFGYEPDIGLDFDVEKAKEYLKKAGYEDAAKVPRLTLAFNTNENHQKVAENVQAQLKRNLGINLELKNEEWKVYLANLKADAHPMFRMGWVADYPDPDNFLNLMISGSQNNRSRWKNKEYDRLISQGASELDKEKRRKIYQNAQKILVEDDVPGIPLFTSVHHYMVAERVENYPANVLNNLPYSKVRFKK